MSEPDELADMIEDKLDAYELGGSVRIAAESLAADILARWRLVPVEPCEHVAQTGVNGDTWACLDCGVHFAY